MQFAASVFVATLVACAFGLPGPRPYSRRQTTVGALVNTTSGPALGTASTVRSDVSAYLGIPFGQAPVGDLRFEPPIAVNYSAKVLNATAFGPDCTCNRIPTSEAYIGGQAGGAILTAVAQTGRPESEDCLSVNVWTKPQSGERAKAVLFWIYGGGFSIGNSANGVYDGSVLADENDVVVVSTNYRLNMFGFSGGPGLTQNVGLLDQRLALEWTRDNIAAFGGDPSRITVFGQSAGGASTDYLSYAYVDDPIAHAYIPQSGVADSLIGGGVGDPYTTWYNVSQNLGCGGQEAGEATVPCVRSKPWDQVLEAMAPLSLVAIASGFGPVVDNVTVLPDYNGLGTSGQFAKLPVLVGNTDDEAAFIIPVVIAYTDINELEAAIISQVLLPIIQPFLDIATLAGFSCSASQAASYRTTYDVPVWRYRFFGGNPGTPYPNLDITFVGSDYHTSELPIVFGSAADVTGVPDSPVESQAGPYMRNAWASFAKDPANGLSELGWPQAADSIIGLANSNNETFSSIPLNDYDAPCPIILGVENILPLTSNVIMNIPAVVQGHVSNSTMVGMMQNLETALSSANSSGLSPYISGINNAISYFGGPSNASTASTVSNV